MSINKNAPPPFVKPNYPWMSDFSQAKLVMDSDRYRISDVPLKNERGVIEFTVSQTILHARQSTTGHSHEQEWEIYSILDGTGIMNIDGVPAFIEPGNHVFVGRGKWHQVINYNAGSDLIFLCYYPGEIVRKHLLTKR